MLFAKTLQKQPVFSRNETGFVDKNLKNEIVVLNVVGTSGWIQPVSF